MCSDSPDTSGMNRAAEANAAVAQDALNWYKQAYAEQAPLREQAARRADEVAAAQLESMRTQTGLANEYADYNRNTFRPVERSLVSDAMSFDTEAERERQAGLALGDVNQQFASARDQASRDLARRGVNPNDGAWAGMQKQITLGQALAGADAKNKARQNALTLGHALKMDAASLGRNLPSNQATSAQLALTAGNSAAGNAQIPVNIAQSATGMAGQGFQTAIAGNSSAGNLYGQAAQIQANSGNDFISGLAGLGQAAGAMGLRLSDERQKEGRKPVSGKVALAAVRRMPVDSWRYKKGGAGDDGGQQHVGPMAQDVHAAAGDAAAPGGTHIDLVSMNGITLAAVQQLDRNQRKLERKVLSLADGKGGKRSVEVFEEA